MRTRRLSEAAAFSMLLGRTQPTATKRKSWSARVWRTNGSRAIRPIGAANVGRGVKVADSGQAAHNR